MTSRVVRRRIAEITQRIQQLRSASRADIDRSVTGLLEELALLEDAVTQTASAQQRAEIESLANTVIDGIVHIDEAGLIVALNSAAERLFGYEEDEILHENVSILMPEPYRSEHDGYIERYARTHEPRIIGIGREVVARRKDGSTFPIALAVGEIADGQRARYVGVIRDLTNQKRAEAQLRESESRLLEAQRIASLGSFESGTSGLDLQISDEARRIFGFDDAQPVTLDSMLERVHPEDRERVVFVTGEPDGDQVPEAIEFRIVRPDQEIRHVVLRTSGARTNGDGPARLIGTVLDVTSERRAHAEIVRARNAMERAERAAQIGIIDLTAPFGSDDIFLSDGVHRIIDNERASSHPMSLAELEQVIHSGDREQLRATIAEAKGQRGSYDLELRIVRPTDVVRTVRVQAEVYADADDHPVRVTAVVQDVTEAAELRRAFHHSQKMEAVGTLTSGIAHDYNNLLMGVAGCTDIALQRLPADHTSRVYLEEVKRAVARGASLTRQLLTFSRPRDMVLQPVALEPILSNVERIVGTMLGSQIELRVVADALHHVVRADVGQLEQIILNLAVNARDAMPNGGTLTISTMPHKVEGPAELPPGAYVALVVSDTGVGIDASTLERIFEPFFTTKPIGAGTGLGLATVYGIVRQFGGNVTVQSEVGRGTTFTVLLPIVASQDLPTTVEPVSADHRTSGETILVIEDEPLVRLTVRTYLSTAGYRTLEACDRSEALLRVREHPAIALVLADVMLPMTSGPEIVEELRGSLPDVPVLYMSAHARDLLVSAGHLKSESSVLQKPFTKTVLLESVRAALDS